MYVKKLEEEVDPMVWFHLAKLSNLSERTDIGTAQQMKQSIHRIIAILSGEHKQEEEPESVRMLQRIAEMLEADKGGLHD
jgi:hypothetical protein